MRPAGILLAVGLPAMIGALVLAGAALRDDLAMHDENRIMADTPVTETSADAAHPIVETRTSRLVAAAEIAPPELGDQPIERVEPREPLGALGLAARPRRKETGPLLHRPVAVESAVVEAGGRRVAIAGTVSLSPDRTCDADGVSWPCGASGRTAFRLWLRGRTLECDLPREDADGGPDRPANGDIAAACRLAGQDAGRWLVANGWALAAPDGPYAEAEKAARDGAKGMFGPPPGGAAPVSTPPIDPPEPFR